MTNLLRAEHTQVIAPETALLNELAEILVEVKMIEKLITTSITESATLDTQLVVADIPIKTASLLARVKNFEAVLEKTLEKDHQAFNQVAKTLINVANIAMMVSSNAANFIQAAAPYIQTAATVGTITAEVAIATGNGYIAHGTPGAVIAGLRSIACILMQNCANLDEPGLGNRARTAQPLRSTNSLAKFAKPPMLESVNDEYRAPNISYGKF